MTRRHAGPREPPLAMLVLSCASCGQTLEIDDGFAGGVCRCRYCRAIQTVPRSASRVPGPPPGEAPPVTVVPADVAASTVQAEPNAVEHNRRLMLAVAAAALLALAAASVAIGLLSGEPPKPPPGKADGHASVDGP